MERILGKLKQISLFAKLKDDPELMREVARIITVKNFTKGGFIIKEGDRGEEMFILNKGSVHVEKTTTHNDSYTVVKLEDFMNVFFGEMALIDNDVRSASVVADNDCECFILTKTDFQNLAEKDHKIGFYVTLEIAKILSGRLRKSSQDTITLFGALVTEIADEEA